MVENKDADTGQPSNSNGHEFRRFSAFFSQNPPDQNHPSLIHCSTTPLLKLERQPLKYVYLLKKKDQEHIVPIVNYFINRAGHVVYLGGDAVKNIFLRRTRKYAAVNVLVILPDDELDDCTAILNNIISSNDGAFSMGLRYWITKNRTEGCFSRIARARYLIEPRLVGCEKLLYPLRSSPIELDLTTQHAFTEGFAS